MTRFSAHPYAITEDPDVRGLFHYTLVGQALQGGELKGQRTGTRSEVEAHVQGLLRRLGSTEATSHWTHGSEGPRLTPKQRKLLEGLA